MAIRKNRILHAGPKSQLGGAKNGLFSVSCQAMLREEQDTPRGAEEPVGRGEERLVQCVLPGDARCHSQRADNGSDKRQCQRYYELKDVFRVHRYLHPTDR
jgi:hypothetical protein